MGLLLVLLSCSGVNSRNSRFGGFNSRQGSKKFPFSLPREFARKALICPALPSPKTAHMGQKRKNSRFHGNNRELGGAVAGRGAVT